MILPVVYTYEFTSCPKNNAHCEQHVYTVCKCVNFAKLNNLIILHSRTLKWHLIFTLLLIRVSFCEASPLGKEYYR